LAFVTTVSVTNFTYIKEILRRQIWFWQFRLSLFLLWVMG